MLSIFKKEKTINAKKVPQGCNQFQQAEQLLVPYSRYLKHIKRLSTASQGSFEKYYMPVIERFAQSVQLLPVADKTEFAKLGGVIEKSLLLAIESMRIRQGYLLPLGSTAEEIARSKELWTFSVFVAGLVHRVGQSIYQYEIVLFDKKGKKYEQRFWPGISDINPDYPYYKILKKSNEFTKLERNFPLLLLRNWLGEDSFNWLLENVPAMDSLLSFMIGGNLDDKNAITDIVQKGYAHIKKTSSGHRDDEMFEVLDDKKDNSPEAAKKEHHEQLSQQDDEASIDSSSEKMMPPVETEPVEKEPTVEKPLIISTVKPKPPVNKKKEKIEKPTAEQFIALVKQALQTKSIDKKMITVEKGNVINVSYPLGLKAFTTAPSELRLELQSSVFWIEERKKSASLSQRILVLSLEG